MKTKVVQYLHLLHCDHNKQKCSALTQSGLRCKKIGNYWMGDRHLCKLHAAYECLEYGERMMITEK